LHEGADNGVSRRRWRASSTAGVEDGGVDEQPDGDGRLEGPVPASYDEGWRWLLDDLASCCRVVDPSPGALVLELPRAGGDHRVEVRMTPREWDEWWSVVHGSVAEGLTSVRRALGRCDAAYAVYASYDLHPSGSPVLRDEV
jgi:hypothetical protein